LIERRSADLEVGLSRWRWPVSRFMSNSSVTIPAINNR